MKTEVHRSINNSPSQVSIISIPTIDVCGKTPTLLHTCWRHSPSSEKSRQRRRNF